MKEEMEHGWYILPNEKIIARKRIPFISSILGWLGFNRTSMLDLYSMTYKVYHSPTNITKMMSYSFPLEHDNFPKPDEYPFYYRLEDGWKIDKNSIVYLKDGPLFSENAHKVIVHSKVFIKSLPQKAWQFIVAFGVLLGIVSSIFRLSGLI